MNGVHPKVQNAAIAGAVSVVIVWAVQQFGHLAIPGEVASAITTILSAVTGYATTDDK